MGWRRQDIRPVLRFLVYVLLVVLLLLLLVRYYHTSHWTTTELNDSCQNGEFIQDAKRKLENGALKTFLEDFTTSTDNSCRGAKYIVYDCSNAWEGDCGGWSDRLAGIMTTFVISILAKRRFLINFDKPCYLNDYLVPAYFDWQYDPSILWNKTSAYHKLRNNNYRQIQKYMFENENFDNYFHEDVIFLRMNWDFTNDFRGRPNIGNDIPWITKYHVADIYKHFLDVFFKLSPALVSALNDHYRTRRKRNKLACVHIRHGNNPNMPRDNKRPEMPLDILWRYFDTLNKDEYDLFVASDTDSKKIMAIERYPDNMIDTPGNITHIDQPHINDPREGFLKQMLDFYTLASCDILIIPSSGFSMLAAFVRNRDSGLYCWRGQDFIPCSRYTINDIYPVSKYGKKPKTYRN